MKRAIKMLQKDRKSRDQVEIVCMEMLVSKEHLLRKIDSAVNFNKIYDFVDVRHTPDTRRL